MLSEILHNIKSLLKLLVICMLVFISAFVVTSVIKKPATLEGFNWEPYRSEGHPASGPKLGERVNLSGLIGRNGEPLADEVKESPIMLAVVDPACRACRIATDEMYTIRDRVAGAGIKYYLVSFTFSKDPSKFYNYADSLGIGVPAFLSQTETQIEALPMMVVPSHILMTVTASFFKNGPELITENQ